MDNDELNLIKNLTKEKIAISNFQKKNFMNKKSDKKQFYRALSSIAACIVLFCGIIFSQDISKQIYALYNKNKVVEVAKSSAHTAKFDSDYDISESEIIDLNNNNNFSQDAIKFKVDEITMDDTSLDLIFDISFSQEIFKDIKEDALIEIDTPDISITDEDGNIIYCSDKNKIYELLGIDVKTSEGITQFTDNSYLQDERFFNSKAISYVRTNNGDSVKLIFNLTLFEQDKYLPRTHKLNINFNNVEIRANLYTEEEISYNFKGEWNIDLELPENIYSRQRNIYKEIQASEENKVLTFNVLSTWTEASLQLKANETAIGTGSPQLNLINAIEIGNPTTQIRDYFVDKLMASEEYKKYEDDLIKNYLIQEAYIEDANGKTYGLSVGAFSNAGGTINDEGYYIPKLILDFKDVDMTDTLKLHIKYLDNDYVFDLVKEGEV